MLDSDHARVINISILSISSLLLAETLKVFFFTYFIMCNHFLYMSVTPISYGTIDLLLIIYCPIVSMLALWAL